EAGKAFIVCEDVLHRRPFLWHLQGTAAPGEGYIEVELVIACHELRLSSQKVAASQNLQSFSGRLYRTHHDVPSCAPEIALPDQKLPGELIGLHISRQPGAGALRDSKAEKQVQEDRAQCPNGQLRLEQWDHPVGQAVVDAGQQDHAEAKENG